MARRSWGRTVTWVRTKRQLSTPSSSFITATSTACSGEVLVKTRITKWFPRVDLVSYKYPGDEFSLTSTTSPQQIYAHSVIIRISAFVLFSCLLYGNKRLRFTVGAGSGRKNGERRRRALSRSTRPTWRGPTGNLRKDRVARGLFPEPLSSPWKPPCKIMFVLYLRREGMFPV